MIDPIIKTKSYRFHAAYIPWIVLFMSVFTLNLKTGMAAISLSAANITRILMVVFAGLLSVFYLLTSKRAFGHVFDIPILCFLMFGIAGIISGAYATEGYYAIWKAIEICVDVIAIVIIFHVSPARNAVLMLFRITVILYALILLSVLVGAVISPSNAFIYMPRAFFKYQLSGVFPIINPNSVGFISAFLSIILLVCFIQTGQRLHKLFYLLLFLVAFISLILAQARTSIVAFIAATSAYLFFDRRIKSLLAFIVALSLLFSLDVSASYLQRGQSKELLNTMSGRTVAWE
ncbi:MAG TPA: hypothetical protein PK024_12210, partial [Methanospirillum sp.]|uniref:hypothetical protein n=1 Tax=Methanospirillum sp. TaxID=45200 RepID=UPI002B5F26D7